ncbi:MAG: hypothetical protein FWH50_03490, partial [Coriobacteriia bacterium]|nr:hypothetical protein [Coriobacteriia bacterium]
VLSPSDSLVYIYLDRTEELFLTQFSDICSYVDELEPWDEIDAVIFDETLDWVIAITHEDFSMTIGL